MLARLALVLPSHVLWLNQKDNVRQESCNSVALFESLSLLLAEQLNYKIISF